MEGGLHSTLPKHNAAYLDAAYWDRRFEHEESYEWFKVRTANCSFPLLP